MSTEYPSTSRVTTLSPALVPMNSSAPTGEIDKFLAHEEVHEHADTVSAHFGDRAVGIAVVHEPAGLRLGREDLPTLRQVFGGHRTDESVAADAAAAVADRRDLFRAQVVFVWRGRR